MGASTEPGGASTPSAHAPYQRGGAPALHPREGADLPRRPRPMVRKDQEFGPTGPLSRAPRSADDAVVVAQLEPLRAHLEAGDDAHVALICIRLSRSRAGRHVLGTLPPREARQVTTARERFESRWRDGARVVDLLVEERRRRQGDEASDLTDRPAS
jgi:hypothetical protein